MPASSLSHAMSYGDANRPLSVLILDDERFDRHRLARLCSGLQRECEITNALTLDGFNALLEQCVYHLILVDYALPDGTGLQALEAVRCSVRNFNSATIMVSGQANSDVTEAALRAGCADYLAKDTLTAQKFQRAVTKALERAALNLQAETQSFARTDVETLLEICNAKFASEIKPLVSRSLRLMRDMRRDPTPDRIRAVEEACVDMWETLIRHERNKGSDVIVQTMVKPEAVPHVGARKPPSPFSRIRQ